jgi:hypothetical protein
MMLTRSVTALATAALLGASAARAQSLGATAAKEKEKRAAQAKEGKPAPKVITQEELEANRPVTPPSTAPTSDAKPSGIVQGGRGSARGPLTRPGGVPRLPPPSSRSTGEWKLRVAPDPKDAAEVEQAWRERAAEERRECEDAMAEMKAAQKATGEALFEVYRKSGSAQKPYQQRHREAQEAEAVATARYDAAVRSLNEFLEAARNARVPGAWVYPE